MEPLSDLAIANMIMKDRGNGGVEADAVHPLNRSQEYFLSCRESVNAIQGVCLG